MALVSSACSIFHRVPQLTGYNKLLATRQVQKFSLSGYHLFDDWGAAWGHREGVRVLITKVHVSIFDRTIICVIDSEWQCGRLLMSKIIHNCIFTRHCVRVRTMSWTSEGFGKSVLFCYIRSWNLSLSVLFFKIWPFLFSFWQLAVHSLTLVFWKA